MTHTTLNIQRLSDDLDLTQNALQAEALTLAIYAANSSPEALCSDPAFLRSCERFRGIQADSKNAFDAWTTAVDAAGLYGA